ncbi:cell wall-binding repeat-containing protein [Pseudolysinimonas kribbensis]|uniref:cell wall-binding repeat-containing protein n=1 Tax=Pseudolysinimonas kribbensis TaxID=433641 RepID=UPI0031DC16B0
MAGAMSGAASATADAGTGSIYGVVTAPDGSTLDGPVTVTLGRVSSQQTDVHGRYLFSGLAAGSFDLTFDYGGTSKIVRHERWDGSFGPTGPDVVLTAGAAREVNVRLVRGATVSGAVTGIDGPLDATTTVTLFWRTSPATFKIPASFDAASQTWQVSDVPPGSYSLLVDPPDRWSSQQWGGLTVVEGVDLVDQSRTLARSTNIGGTVSYVENGVASPLPDGVAWAWNHKGGEISAPIVNGRYDFYGLWADSYTICFQEQNYVDLTCYGGGGFYDPPNVTVSEGEVLDGIDATVVRGGQILGEVHGAGDPQWQVRLLRRDPDTGDYGDELDSYTSAAFGFSAVAAGTYRLQVVDQTNANRAQYWDGAQFADGATDIVVTSGHTVDLGTITAQPWNIDMQRTGGSDRFAVSAAVSNERFPVIPASGVPVVYVADGLNFPDALSAGPAAIKDDGDILLVTPMAIPPPIAAELARLRPQRIVVVGGTASVNEAVLHQLDAYVTGASGKATRLAGVDRFAASRNVARSAFGTDGAPTVFIATGNNYPDALSAGPAAGSVSAPVILVDGLASHLDSATTALLHDLHTTSVDIVGGPASLSFGIQEDLEGIVGPSHVTVFGGSTRYDNAAQLGATFFRHTDLVYFAVGTNFADALSAAALAGHDRAPIDLVESNCVPASVEYWVRAQAAQSIRLIGGQVSLGSGVEAMTPCPA